MNQRSIKRWVRFGVFVAVALMAGFFLKRYEWFTIPVGDQSMAPEYPAGSRVMCEEIDPDEPIERGTDVVYAMEWEGVMRARFGRVRGVPGDEIGSDEEGRLTVNGETIGPIGIRGQPMGRVPEGRLFILVVNPQEVTYPDSRSPKVGFVPRADIRARIAARWGISGGP